MFFLFLLIAYCYPLNSIDRENIATATCQLYRAQRQQVTSLMGSELPYLPKLDPQSPFDQAALSLAMVLDESEKNPSRFNERQWRSQLSDKWRFLATKLRGNPSCSAARPAQGWLAAFSRTWYARCDLTESLEHLCQQYCGVSWIKPNPSSPRAFVDNLEMLYEGIKKATQSLDKKKCAAPFIGDLPSLVFQWPAAPSSPVLRMANPTTESVSKLGFYSQREAPVHADFEAFILSQAAAKKRHFYINLMRRQGSEGVKSEALEKLERDKQLDGYFCIATFDKNSDFYWQRGSREEKAAQFQKELFQHLFAPPSKSHFYWPQQLRIDEWQKTCFEAIKKIHERDFASREVLSAQERADFIELLYADLMQSLVEKLAPHTVNISCRACIDRGPGAYTLLYLQLLTHYCLPWNERAFVHTATWLFGPALYSAGRLPEHRRVERLISSARRIASRTS